MDTDNDQTHLPDPGVNKTNVSFGVVMLDCVADLDDDRAARVSKELSLTLRGQHIDPLGRVVLDLRTIEPWVDGSNSAVHDFPPLAVACDWVKRYGSGSVAVKSAMARSILRLHQFEDCPVWRSIIFSWSPSADDVMVSSWRFAFDTDHYYLSQTNNVPDMVPDMVLVDDSGSIVCKSLATNRLIFEAIAASHLSEYRKIGLAYLVTNRILYVAAFVPDTEAHASRIDALLALDTTGMLFDTTKLDHRVWRVIVGYRSGLLCSAKYTEKEAAAAKTLFKTLGVKVDAEWP